MIEELFDSLSRAGLETPQKARGSVTRIIERIGEGDEEAKEQLFDVVIQQLRDKADGILRRYQNAIGLEADDLVNTVYVKLMNRLAACKIANRQHFMGTACQHFNWLLLEEIRGPSRVHPGLSFSLPDLDGKSPGELVVKAETLERALEALWSLDESLRQVVYMHVWLDMTFEQIGQELQMGSSTAHDRYQRALDSLKKATE
jgi:RNA polymerase sigma factor (sigma-70 family)